MGNRYLVEVVSPLPLSECVSRLRAATDNRAIEYYFGIGSKPVVAKISDCSFRLRRRIWYSNSFQTYLSATMRPQLGGTVISGECGMHPTVVPFSIIWFALVAVSMLLAPGLKVLHGQRDEDALFGLIICSVMLGLGIGIVRFGRYLARNEARILSDFIFQTLDAGPINPNAQTP